MNSKEFKNTCKELCKKIVNLEKYINLSLKDWKLDSKRKPDNKSKKKMLSF